MLSQKCVKQLAKLGVWTENVALVDKLHGSFIINTKI